jgi:uncharacterized protein
MIIERKLYREIAEVITSPEVVVVTGMRRVGKTTLLRYLFDRVESVNKIWLDLENPVNQRYFDEINYDRILADWEKLGLKKDGQNYVFLDEIQLVKNLPQVVKYLYDHYQIKFVLTGSSSYYLKNLFTESLAGRKFIFELYPLDFGEFLQLKNSRIQLPAREEKVTPVLFELIDQYYSEYLEYGGFPGVVSRANVQDKLKMLDDIFSAYFQLEVVQLGDFRKTKVVRDLILLLMSRIGTRLDVQKLSKELGVARETINNYLSFLESTYFIKLIKPFSRNRDTEIRRAPKFYLCDVGLARRLAKIDEGVIFENAVFNSLGWYGGVNYYQKKQGAELDFVVDEKFSYEVKLLPYKPDEVRLKKISQKLGLKDWWLVSRKYSELKKVIYGFML